LLFPLTTAGKEYGKDASQEAHEHTCCSWHFECLLPAAVPSRLWCAAVCCCQPQSAGKEYGKDASQESHAFSSMCICCQMGSNAFFCCFCPESVVAGKEYGKDASQEAYAALMQSGLTFIDTAEVWAAAAQLL
jgi:hypothetical protein